MPIQSVAIIGAGVAGLTTALSFARFGVRCDILEQAPVLQQIGAGLQISPNAARILAELGVLREVEGMWIEPRSIELACGMSLKHLTALPVGALAMSRWGAPYGVLHRATLQLALVQAVANHPLCRLHTGKRIETTDRAAIDAVTGGGHDLIVGADGVWSNARYGVPGSPASRFSGHIAWRFTVSAEEVPDFFVPGAVTVLLGPKGHIVAYPLRETGGFNIVAISAGADAGDTWKAESGQQKALLLKLFGRWNAALAERLAAAPEPNFWPIYQTGPGHWQNGRDTVLIGDAAHAMPPFAAQGAAMAIEDAFELAAFTAGRFSLDRALPAFEAHRAPRLEKVRKRAALNRFAYHAQGPLRLTRNIVMSMREPEAFLSDLDWLYGYRAVGLSA